jgi:hypothetical protein
VKKYRAARSKVRSSRGLRSVAIVCILDLLEVYRLVLGETAAGREGLHAELAHKWVWDRLVRSLVHLEMGRRNERLLAHFAHVRSLARMASARWWFRVSNGASYTLNWAGSVVGNNERTQ